MNTRERLQSQGHRVPPFCPLAGVRVIECGVLLAGPFCARPLADFGAGVIKVEPPGEGDPRRTTGQALEDGKSLWWPSIARTKKCIALNLPVPEGQGRGPRISQRKGGESDVAAKTFTELLKDAPKNWGRWGADDEIGALNFLTNAEVLRGVRAVKQGKVFALGVPLARPGGDPIYPGRGQPTRTMAVDKGSYMNGHTQAFPGGLEYSDDVIFMFLQGTTQYDALGHVWYDDQMYNGYDAKTTIGGLRRCSIERIAEHGVVGRGILLDVARYKGVKHLQANEGITLDDLLKTAEYQKSPIEKHDILLIHTGWLKRFYDEGPEAFFPDKQMREPGLSYSPELVRWFYDMEIPSLGSDTVASEQTVHPESETFVPLHAALLRNLGVVFNEIDWLADLADDCAKDGQYTFLFVGSPLKVVGGAGSPVNPIVIK